MQIYTSSIGISISGVRISTVLLFDFPLLTFPPLFFLLPELNCNGCGSRMQMDRKSEQSKTRPTTVAAEAAALNVRVAVSLQGSATKHMQRAGCR